MARRTNARLFIITAGLTLAVFVGGLALGLMLDDLRVDDVVGTLRTNELNIESFLTEQQFLNTLGDTNVCGILEPRFQQLSKSVGELGRTLAGYEASRIFRQEDYDYLKSRYSVLEVRSYLLLLQLKEQCMTPRVSVLFFYKQDDEESIRQGLILDALVQKYGESNLTVYSFDRYFDNEVIKLLLSHYNVTAAPALVIDNEIVFNGSTPREQLEDILRPRLLSS